MRHLFRAGRERRLQGCGESFRAGNRRGGLIRIAAGAALGLGGLLLTLVSHAGGTGGANVAFVGLMSVGGALIVMGLVSLVSGARADSATPVDVGPTTPH